MSSFQLSVSGARALTSTVNDQSRTFASMPSKTDDNVSVQFGSFAEISMMLPKNARLERVVQGGSEFVRLVVPGALLVYGKVKAETPGWPHVFLNAGKHIDDYYAEAEVVETIHEEIGALIPTTE